jgi:DNA polymerase III subunit epsilon
MTAFPPAILATPLDQMALTFLDIESTGLIPNADRICEIALRRVRGNTIEASYTVLVNPNRPMGAQALQVHGITPDMLADAPLFAAVAPNVWPLLLGSALVAHNAPFDVAFLSTELDRLGLPPLTNPVLDTLVLSRRLLRRSSHSLRSLATDLGLPSPAHRAMSDVLALHSLFEILRVQLAERGITTVEETLRFQRGLLPGQPERDPPPIIEEALRSGRRLYIVYRSLSSPEPTLRLVRPIEITHERSGLFLRAFCYLRNDLRSFALEKIDSMELAD